jgi:two-component system KDP operon response regulator KdpE
MSSQPANGKVLIVDDEAPIRKFLSISLGASGYAVIEAASGSDALAEAALRQPDLIVLDLGLPDIDGQEVIRRLREWSAIPILVLSVRDDESEKVSALDGGANDYVTKPFGINELLARLRALRRIARLGEAGGGEANASFGPLAIDYVERRVALDGVDVHLTRKEYELLRLMTRNAGKVLTHRYLLREVWGPAQAEGDQAQVLRVHMGNLRAKLGDDPAAPAFILTEPGVGYRFIG